jgi:hypothetical protein
MALSCRHDQCNHTAAASYRGEARDIGSTVNGRTKQRVRRSGFRVLTSSGVNVGGHRFHSAATYQLLHRVPRERDGRVRVRCAWYPDDCSFILVWDPFLENFVSLPNVNLACSKGMSWSAGGSDPQCSSAQQWRPLGLIRRSKSQSDSTLV